MNGIVPGPLWIAIASATKGALLENGALIHQTRSDTVTGKRADIDKESMKRRFKTGVNGGAAAAARESAGLLRFSSLEGGTGEENENRHGTG